MAPLITQGAAQRPVSWGVAPIAFSMLLAAGPTITVPVVPREHTPELVITATSGTIKSAEWLSTVTKGNLASTELTVEDLRELSGLSASEMGRGLVFFET